MAYSIAIDGPAGAGKSTIAKAAAKRLGFIYVDTGAMYRAMGLYMLREGIDGDDEETQSARCAEAQITICYEDGVQQVYLNGENVNALIRTEEVGKMASAVARNKDVRLQLVYLQRALAERENVIMDGRDIGTYVLPDATCKIYLTASVEERGRRRFLELRAKGIDCDLEEIKADIEARDQQDMNRDFAPLRQAEDAVLLDSSDLGPEEVVEEVLRIFEESYE
ncbi:MAG: (d)CMP kinase [Lachnospiraceae bacterium]|nr:(d)CMP kinase [Lachnospiraceae bacterium]MBQ9592311.1 (d)CMP kinase [Lachnospiraceae bacterium]